MCVNTVIQHICKVESGFILLKLIWNTNCDNDTKKFHIIPVHREYHNSYIIINTVWSCGIKPQYSWSHIMQMLLSEMVFETGKDVIMV